jgi:ankyrin repeat protein
VLPASQGSARGCTVADLDGDGETEILVSSRAGAVILSASGREKGTLPLPDDTESLVAARGRKAPFLIAFSTWGQAIHASDTQGRRLWSYGTEDSVDWACLVDIHGGGGDAIAIGYNGAGGVRLLNADGTPRWHARGPANVWSVAAVRLTKRGKCAVACVQAGGSILLYSADGEKIRELQAGSGTAHPLQAGAVYGTDLDGDGADEVLGLGTTVASGEYLWAFDARGRLRWRSVAQSGAARIKGPLAAGRFWPSDGGRHEIAVGHADGTIFLFDSGGQPLPGLRVAPDLRAFSALPRHGTATDALIAVTSQSVVCYEWQDVPPQSPGVFPSPEPPQPPLIAAVLEGDTKKVQALLKASACPDLGDDQGALALHIAASLGHKRMVEALLDAGTNLFARVQGDTALMAAAGAGHADVVRFLLWRGADVHERNPTRWTPLLAAAAKGSLATVQILLRAGADPRAEDVQGRTALSYAVMEGYTAVAGMLLKHGAAVDDRDWYGTTPLMWAALGGHLETIRLLVAHQANVNARDDATRRRYGRAQFTGDQETVARIKATGALETLREDGTSVLGWASIRRNEEVLQFLRQAGARQ